MSGNISAQSTLGKGTFFTLLLPLVEVLSEPLKSKDELHVLLPKPNILVVNDNPVNRMVLAKFLEKDNHKVVSVANGLKAVEYANGQALDLILMDIQMPEMNGLTATKAIRAGASQNKNIPIIAVTADLEKTEHFMALSAGMSGFISKPIRYE
jgi:CheY-like chemotaxis protein